MPDGFHVDSGWAPAIGAAFLRRGDRFGLALAAQVGLEPGKDAEHERGLLCAVSTLWDEAAASASDDPPSRGVVVLEALRDPSAPSLFEPDPRERRLQWMLDRVRERYGARALLWGVCNDPRGPYTGAKIAYQSFPDMDWLQWLGLAGAGTFLATGLRSCPQ